MPMRRNQDTRGPVEECRLDPLAREVALVDALDRQLQAVRRRAAAHRDDGFNSSSRSSATLSSDQELFVEPEQHVGEIRVAKEHEHDCEA